MTTLTWETLREAYDKLLPKPPDMLVCHLDKKEDLQVLVATIKGWEQVDITASDFIDLEQVYWITIPDKYKFLKRGGMA